jgi:hypothetical protein
MRGRQKIASLERRQRELWLRCRHCDHLGARGRIDVARCAPLARVTDHALRAAGARKLAMHCFEESGLLV